MASLKALRNKIANVQSTRRITSAMKMVAAAKLRKAQQRVEAARPYAERMERMLLSLAKGHAQTGEGPLLLSGTGRDQTHLLVLVTSDRGLCGGFNGNLARSARAEIDALRTAGKTVKLMIVGRRGASLLRRDHRDKIVKVYEELCKPEPAYDHALQVSGAIRSMLESGECDSCTLFYNKFVSALTQQVTPLRLVPFTTAEEDDGSDQAENKSADDRAAQGANGAQYEYEPDEEAILEALLPKNLAVQVFRSMLESFASEQGARMTAMDNATRNAGDMIQRLSITYNRSRQAQITKELIEIISGAEAL